jgi:hypothetical protein
VDRDPHKYFDNVIAKFNSKQSPGRRLQESESIPDFPGSVDDIFVYLIDQVGVIGKSHVS